MIENIKCAYLIYFLVAVFALSFVQSSVITSIDVDPVFRAGEQVYFNYSIVSDKTERLDYMLGISCSNIPQPMLISQGFDFIAGFPISGSYSDFIVGDNYESQLCSASIYFEGLSKSFSEEFNVLNKDRFNFYVLFNKNVFVKDEQVAISYDSEVLDLVVEAYLEYPDKRIERISLPTTFVVDQLGLYTLFVNVSKEGYIGVDRVEQFVVIAENAQIADETFQSDLEYGSDVIDYGSTNVDKPRLGENGVYLKIVFFVFCFLIAVLVIYFLLKRRNNK